MRNTDRIFSLLQRAEAATREKNEDEARRLLKAALRYDPTNDQALVSLVFLAEDGQASLTYLAQLLDAHPRHPQAQRAIRWVQQRIPTSVPSRSEKLWPGRTRATVFHIPRRLVYGLAIIVLLAGLGLLWESNRPHSPAAQANASVAALSQASVSSTAQPSSETVQVSIPLFTSTPMPTLTPRPFPSPTPSSAWVVMAGHPQTKNLSCESRSAADLAGFWGVAVNELEFLIALGQSDNPHVGFVGNVDAAPGSLPPHGYGVYAEPVAATLRKYGLDARAVYYLGLDGLKAELLAGRPVLVWATYGMEAYAPIEWASSDGQISTVVPFMHTFLVTGFDAQGLTFLDAFDATVQYYDFETFLRIWNLFDQMALIVIGPAA
jgi:uncharacterized protein YvpB